MVPPFLFVSLFIFLTIYYSLLTFTSHYSLFTIYYLLLTIYRLYCITIFSTVTVPLVMVREPLMVV